MSSEARLKLVDDNLITILGVTPTYALRLAEIAHEQGVSLAANSVRALLVAGELRDRHSEWSIVELSAETAATVFVRDVGELRVHRRVDLRHLVVTATAEQGAGWSGDGLFVVDLHTGKWSRIGARTAEVAGVLGGEVIVLDEGRLLRVPWSDPRRSPTMVCDAIFDRVVAVAGDRVIALREDKTQCCVVDLGNGSMRSVALPAALSGAQAMVLDAAVSADGRRVGLAAFSGACCVIELESLQVAWMCSGVA